MLVLILYFCFKFRCCFWLKKMLILAKCAWETKIILISTCEFLVTRIIQYASRLSSYLLQQGGASVDWVNRAKTLDKQTSTSRKCKEFFKMRLINIGVLVNQRLLELCTGLQGAFLFKFSSKRENLNWQRTWPAIHSTSISFIISLQTRRFSFWPLLQKDSQTANNAH